RFQPARHEVFYMEDPNDIVGIRAIDRNAREMTARNLREDTLRRSGQVERKHLLAWSHYLDGPAIAEVEDPVNQFAFLRLDLAQHLTSTQQRLEFLFRYRFWTGRLDRRRKPFRH